MIRLKENITEEQLEKYGFKDGVITREINGNVLYWIGFHYETRQLMIQLYRGFIAGSLQSLIYHMTLDGILEEY